MMNHKKLPIVAIIGRSNSGKTTLAEKLINFFSDTGLRVLAIKHSHHNFEMDKKGKDSYRLKKAGAKTVAIVNDNMYAIVSDNENSLGPVDIAEKLISHNFDLIIIEGYKEAGIPMIEVVGDSKETALFTRGNKNIIAIASDNKPETSLPVFKRDDIKGIAEFIKDVIITIH